MKKTKIVCTMGPNTNDREMMRKLIQNGICNLPQLLPVCYHEKWFYFQGF